MRTAIFKFKCRHCNCVYDGPHTNEHNALPTLVELFEQPKNSMPQLGAIISKTRLHHCKDDGLGIADLIGCSFADN